LSASVAQDEDNASSAPELVILVVNRNQVFSVSDAGKDMRAKMSEIQKLIAADEEKERTDLIAEAQELLKQRAILTNEQLGQKQQELARKEEFIKYKFNQELVRTRERAQVQIANVLGPILQTLMTERNGTILIDHANLVMASMDYDVTAETTSRLNAQLPSIEVERVLWANLVKASEEAERQRKAQEEAAAASPE
jgi:Skp family chaperone for outer membrane proteins